MTSLSVVMIVKNEADNLKECLPLLAWADEIVIYDSGSGDETATIARQFTDRVFVDEDWQGFGEHRRRAQAKASSDWILMIDADERVTPELSDQIRNIVKQNQQHCVYALPRLSWCFGRFIRHSGWYPDYVVRLYPRLKAEYGHEKVHERVHYPADMQLQKLSADLIHFTYNDLEHYLVKSARYAAIWADVRAERGTRSSLSRAVLHGMACFIKMYILRLGMLDGRQGLLLALLSAHSTFAKYADLWIRYQPQRASSSESS